MRTLFWAFALSAGFDRSVYAQPSVTLGAKMDFFSRCKDFFGRTNLFLEQSNRAALALGNEDFVIRVAQSVIQNADFYTVKINLNEYRPWNGDHTKTVGPLRRFLPGTLRRQEKVWDDKSLRAPYQIGDIDRSLWKILSYPLPEIIPNLPKDRAGNARNYRPRLFPDQVYSIYRTDVTVPVGAIRYTAFPANDLPVPLDPIQHRIDRELGGDRQTVLIEGFDLDYSGKPRKVFERKVSRILINLSF